jgi:Xaa-Pro aminopeptidase
MKRRTLSVLITIALVAVVFLPMSRATVAANEPEPPAIRITPPAPVFDDAKRLDELAARRKKVADSIGPKSMLVLFGAEPRVYTNDVDFPFRQENNFFYLTNLNQQREILVLMPGNAGDARDSVCAASQRARGNMDRPYVQPARGGPTFRHQRDLGDE